MLGRGPHRIWAAANAGWLVMALLERTSGTNPASDAAVRDDGLGAAAPRMEKVLGKRLLRLVVGPSVGRREGRLLKFLPKVV